ncbi:MAG: alpha/beta hydrolase [Bacteroidota bacterium]
MKNIIFVHGMFQNPKSWEKWTAFFSERGYSCIAPAWPKHEGEPSDLRNNPPEGLGELSLDEVTTAIEILALKQDKPIVIGHSVGGLIAQLLVNRDVASIGVAINSVAPNMMLDFDWGFLKNSAIIANPLKGDEPIYTDPEMFHGSFANTLSEQKSLAAFEATATHDSRNVLRDCMGSAGHLNLDAPHAPLLLIAGEKDEIIPNSLVEKNYKAYTDEQSVTDFVEFENRSHYICNEPGWEEVANYVYGWLQQQEERIERSTAQTHIL